MLDEIRRNRGKKNANRPNLSKGVYTQPSQTIGNANIAINSEIAIPNLEKLAKYYNSKYNAKGFITNLCNALGLPMKNQSSQYGEVEIPFINPTCKASLRITAHNANAENNIKHDANYPYNLSIVVRNKMRRNTFHAHDDVFMDEFAYYGDRWKSIESPMSQIITSIIQFLKTGIYKDTTGVALTNVSPDSRKSDQNSLLSPPLDPTTQSRYSIPTNISDVDGTNQPANDWGADYVSESKDIYNYKSINCNKNMNRNSKNVVRLSESKLREMIKESVKQILKESEENDSEFQHLVQQTLQRVKNGENPYNVFDWCGHFNEGYIAVELNRKWNWIDTEGNPLSPNQWFDSCGNFANGYAMIELNGKDNFIDTEGNLYDYKTRQPLGKNVKTMNNQNESVMKDIVNMVVEKVMRQMRML